MERSFAHNEWSASLVSQATTLEGPLSTSPKTGIQLNEILDSPLTRHEHQLLMGWKNILIIDYQFAIGSSFIAPSTFF